MTSYKVAMGQDDGADSYLNPLTLELIKVHEWASGLRAKIAPLQKTNEELEGKLQIARAEIKDLADELEEVKRALSRHRENEHIAEQRLETLRRENTAAMGGKKIIFDGQTGFQAEVKPI